MIRDEHGACIVDRDEHRRSAVAAELLQDLYLPPGAGAGRKGQMAAAVARVIEHARSLLVNVEHGYSEHPGTADDPERSVVHGTAIDAQDEYRRLH